MKTKYFLLTLILGVSLVLSTFATASVLIPSSDRAKEVAQCTENSPAISLTESGEWELERVDFIHFAKPPWAGGGGKGEKCYKLLGVKWKELPTDYVINPTNSDGLSEAFITNAFSTSAETWDSDTSAELFNDSYSIDYNSHYGIQNFENTLEFGSYPDDGVIAVTSVWFTRRGKKIVEFDILFNERFAWGDATSDSSLMDLQNIAVHELGHGIGLDDIYSLSCSDVTMYGFSDTGETKKRTLEAPDIEGLQKMYGI